MTFDRAFPVLRQMSKAAMPQSVPWSFAETFRAQAERNHSQTLERLAERGGLAPEEMHLAAHGRSRSVIDEATAIEWLVDAVRKHTAERIGGGR